MTNPVIATEFTLYIILKSGSSPITNPTITSGDFTYSKDGAAFTNLASLPTVTPTNDIQVSVTLSATEMDGGAITLYWHDPDSEWDDGALLILTENADLTAAEIVAALPSGTVVARSSTDIDNTTITAKRGDSWFIEFEGLGSLATRTKLYFSVKDADSNTDYESTVQIEETDGLLYIAQGSPTAVNGAINVTDENAGALTVYLKTTESAKTTPKRTYIWDLQMIDNNGDAFTLTSGTFIITGDATRATN